MVRYSEEACIAVACIFSVMAIAAMTMRVYSHFKYSNRFETGDFFIIPAFFLTITAGVAIIIGAKTDTVGGHSNPITEAQAVRVGKFEYAFWIGHVVTIVCVKLSILFFFRRLFKGRGMRTTFDIINWVLITLVCLWGVSFLFADIFACGIYPEASWNTQFWRHNVCINTFAMQIASAATNWLIDLAILIEPLIMIGSLQLLNTKKKLQASAVFLISTFAVIAGLLRMTIWIQINVQGHFLEVYSILGYHYAITDLKGIATLAIFWTYIEISVGFLVAALLPSAKLLDSFKLGPVMDKFRNISSIFSSRSGRSTKASNSNASESRDVEEKGSERSESFNNSIRKNSSLQHYDREIEEISGMGEGDEESRPV